MASKRDQLHSYQFLVQRTVSALVTRQSDPEQPPFRRPGNAAFGGIALAVLALAAVWVYGLIVPGGNDAWRDGQSVVIEKETGTRYVYLAGRLHPVRNHTSALLALNHNAGTVSVSRKSLAGVPRGPRIGIPDAPDALPGRDQLLAGGWTLCSQPNPDPTGAVVPRSVLLVGQQPASGLRMTGRAVLVTVRDTGETYLVHDGYRHRITADDRATVLAALGLAPELRISPAVAEALPLGLPLGPIPIPGAGAPSTAVTGRTDLLVGQLAVATTSRGVQRYLVEPARLRPITELQYDIQRAYLPTAGAYAGAPPEARALNLLDVGGATLATIDPPAEADPPGERPDLVPGAAEAALCLTFPPDTPVPALTLAPALPEFDPLIATPRRTEGRTPLADLVSVPPGQAAVVEAMPGPQAQAGTVMVITDQGVGYPLAHPAVLTVLGYEGVRPVRVPATVVARLPVGSGLSHEAAMRR